MYDRDAKEWGELYLGSGDVGIGTALPEAKLDARGTVSTGNGGIVLYVQ